jgi:hypothetical protein
MRSDFELAKLGANMIVSNSSLPLNINPFLNPKKGKKDKKFRITSCSITRGSSFFC